MDIDEKRESASTEIMSVNLAEEDSDLDPVKLKQAFKFAAWSSVILVSAYFPFSSVVGKRTSADGELSSRSS